MGVVLSRASHASGSLAANTNALDVAIQLSRGLCHMSAISVAGGKHAVVDGTRHLSTGLAAFFSVVTPGNVEMVCRQDAAMNATAKMNRLLDQIADNAADPEDLVGRRDSL